MIMLSSLINDTNNAVNKYKYCDSISMLQSCIDYLREFEPYLISSVKLNFIDLSYVYHMFL